MLEWQYNGGKFNPSDIDSLYGFVYKLTYEYYHQEYIYIGKKNFFDARTKSLTKKELSVITDKRLKTNKTVTKESNWRKYIGSCKDEKLDDMIIVEKEILKVIPNNPNMKIQLTYWEAYYLFGYDAITSDKCLNGNILGSFFRGRI